MLTLEQSRARDDLLKQIDSDYSLSYAEWVEVLSSTKQVIEDDLKDSPNHRRTPLSSGEESYDSPDREEGDAMETATEESQHGHTAD